jgi:DNA-binding transcriptional LysR family regulator
VLDVGALTLFVAVIDTGSFPGAAERLGQTPSGVSRTLVDFLAARLADVLAP